MIIKEISCTMGRTLNMGNYESLRVEVSATALIPEGEDREAVMVPLQAYVKSELVSAISIAKAK